MDFVEPVTDDEEVDESDEAEAVRHVRRNALQYRSGISGYRCEECGDAIPEDRRQAEPGTEHCAECVFTLQLLMNEACDEL
ncbi:TraR/DksA C4-type zinc finger protein [Pseudomonas lactis]|uniref:TraR/DksA C4-type zinc finger protein n=1 Tax=Pseudomonas lactis TaxID=1615674 RepID=UPI001909354C|nr:TraR/DksA C4-type zinc finger protein [Pseudomonas lactis]MBK3440783.1 TraR/DksA C4-type zinc finger protein [Pseudomonas lactis]